MAQTMEDTFRPEAEGLRVSATPMHRRQRTPSEKDDPKPQFADAIWYTFQNSTKEDVAPLEAVVRKGRVDDTIRALKRAQRWLVRNRDKDVRVQIAVEAAKDSDGNERPRMAVVKFLGHPPYELGRRVALVRAQREAEAAAKAAEVEHVVPEPGQHRKRSVAVTRSTHARVALRNPLVRAVITAGETPCVQLPSYGPAGGFAVPGRVEWTGVYTSDRFSPALGFSAEEGWG